MPSPNTTLPPTNRLLGAYFQVHAPIWAGPPMAEVLTPEQSAEITRLTAKLQAAIAATDEARVASRAATKMENEAAAELRRAGNARIATIRSYATTSVDPAAVLDLAKVPPRAKPTPTPAPLAPTNATATLDRGGVVTVIWDGSIADTSFRVDRRLIDADNEASDWVQMDFDGFRPFRDATVPTGTVSASYRVRGARRGKVGPWSEPAELQYVASNSTARPNLQIAA